VKSKALDWRVRLGEWIGRYGLAELCGLVSAVTGSWLARLATGDAVASAYGGALGENIGYYGVIITREINADARACRDAGRPYGMRDAGRTARNLLFEFGGAEVLDTGVIRPLAMGIGARFLGDTWGVVAGKIAADIAFYVPVIAVYEFRRGRERRRADGIGSE
jgi:hypothetical protein